MGQMNSFVTTLSRQIQLGAAEQAALVMECFRGSTLVDTNLTIGQETVAMSPYSTGIVGPLSFVASCTVIFLYTL